RWVLAAEPSLSIRQSNRADPAAQLEPALVSRLWSNGWPKLAAVALAIALWQGVAWSGWQPDYLLPGPVPVLQRLAADLGHLDFYYGVGITLRRALIGYSLAVVIGTVLGILVARLMVLRKAIGA